MKIGPLEAFATGFAVGFIFLFSLGLGIGSLFGFNVVLGSLIGGVTSGVITGIAAVFLFYALRTVSRNKTFTIAGVLLLVGLLVFPPLDAIAIVVFLMGFLRVKKGR